MAEIYGAAQSADVIVVGGTNGKIYRSIDNGALFSIQPTPATTQIEDIAYGGAVFKAVTGNSIWTGNSQGTVWGADAHIGFVFNAVEYGGGYWVVAGDNNSIKSSSDGLTWITRNASLGTEDINKIRYGYGVFMMVGTNGTIVKSSDYGSSWSSVTSPTSEHLYAVEFYGGRWVIGGANGAMYYSDDDGSNWTAVTSRFSTSTIYAISYYNEIWTAHGESGIVSYSSDNAETWTLEASSPFSKTVYASVRGRGVIALYEMGDDLTPWRSTAGTARHVGGWLEDDIFHYISDGDVYRFGTDNTYVDTQQCLDFFSETPPSYVLTSPDRIISCNHDKYRGLVNWVFNASGTGVWYTWNITTGSWDGQTLPSNLTGSSDLQAVAVDPETGWYAITNANDLYIYNSDLVLQQTFLNIATGFVKRIGFYKSRDGLYDYFGWNYGGGGGNHWCDRQTLFDGTLFDLVGIDDVADALNNAGSSTALGKLYPSSIFDYETRRACSVFNTSGGNIRGYMYSMEDTFTISDGYSIQRTYTTTESDSPGEVYVMLDESSDTRSDNQTQPWRSLGRRGEYGTRVIWRQRGQHRSYTPTFKISGPVKRAVFAVYANIEPCNG